MVIPFIPRKTAERIEVLLTVDTLGDLRHIVLDGGPDLSTVLAFDAAIAKLLWLVLIGSDRELC